MRPRFLKAKPNVLLLRARRRVPFARCLKVLMPEFGGGRILIGDDDPFDPTIALADGFVYIPPPREKDYLASLLREAEANSIGLIIPWLDMEICKLRSHEFEFRTSCIRIAAPPSLMAQTFHDKVRASEWLLSRSLKTPRRYDGPPSSFPVAIKPRFGQGSVNVRFIQSLSEFHSAAAEPGEPVVVEEFVDGPEYTIDIGATTSGTPLFVVPRKRSKVRGSEAVVSEVVEDPILISISHELASHLRFSAIVNIQIIVGADGPRVIDLNPRFGGGSDLSIAAGANIPRYILEDWHHGRFVSPRPVIEHGLIMSRYLESTFFRRGPSTTSSVN